MVSKTTVALRKADIEDMPQIVQWSYDDDFCCTIFQGAGDSVRERTEFLSKKLVKASIMYSQEKLYIAETPVHKAIGLICFLKIDWKNQNLSLEHHIDHRYQKSPVIFNVLDQACLLAFQEFNMRKAVFFVHSDNKRMLEVFDYFRLEPEVVYKQHSFRNGKYWDLHQYARYREDNDMVAAVSQGEQSLLEATALKLLLLRYIDYDEFRRLDSDETEVADIFFGAVNRMRKKHALKVFPRITKEDIEALDAELDSTETIRISHGSG